MCTRIICILARHQIKSTCYTHSPDTTNKRLSGYLMGCYGLVVTLQSVDSLGVAQCPPLVPLVSVGLGQHFQFVCDVLVEVITFGLRRLGTDPLPWDDALSSRVCSGLQAGARSLLLGGLTSDKSFQVTLRDPVFFSAHFLLSV